MTNMSSQNFMELCRLCLVKERVSIPIFEGEGDIRQIFQKIAACLPVKVDKDDKLPKKICDSCLYKVENVHQFWNTTAKAEKQLLQWLGEIKTDDKLPSNTTTIETEQLMLKEEAVEHDQAAEHSKTLGQVETAVEDERRSDEEEETESDEGSNSEDSVDDDAGEAPSKEEAESDEEPYGELEPTTFVNVSLACDEAGPSGLQQSQAIPQTQQHAQSTTQLVTQDAPSTSKAAAVPATSGLSSGNYQVILDNSVYKNSNASNSSLRAVNTQPTLVGFLATTSMGIPIQYAVQRPKLESENKTESMYFYVPIPTVQSTSSIASGINFNQDHVNHELQMNVVDPTANVIQLPTDENQIGESFPVLTDKKPVESGSEIKLPTQSDLCDSKIKNKCHICQKGFKNNKQFQNHMRSHVIDRRYTCKTCCKSFRTSYELTSHMKVHTSQKEHVCNICGFATVYKSSLMLHKLRHEPNFRFKCDVCGKGFYYNCSFKAHRAIHATVKPFRCNDCGKAFTKKHYLQNHQKIHQKDRKVFKCESCDKTFSMKKSLSLHMRRDHTGEINMHLCDICGKAVTSSYSLQIHRRIHTGEKPYVCDLCGKSFGNRAIFRVHQRTHTGEKPYSCEKCNKTFTQRSTLVIHTRYHTGQRPYKCVICNKDFVSKTLLKSHQKNHTVD